MPTGFIHDIPALWETPDGGGTRRLVVWLPGFTSRKEEVLRYLRELAAAGYTALSFDPVDHGERSRTAEGEHFAPESGSFRDATSGMAYRHYWSILAETAEELPAVIDWAIATLGVERLVGVGGISMGGTIAVVAAGLDRRIAAVAGGLAEGDWQRIGAQYPLSAPNLYVQSCYDRCNPLINLERYQHRPALSFQLGAEDTMIPPGSAQRFVHAVTSAYAASPERLEIVLEEAVGHEFTDGMWRRSLDWFGRFL